jgi:hypothetical protein
MCSSNKAGDGSMCSEAQVVITRQVGKELHNGLVPRWIAWISRLAKADRKREDVSTDLVKIHNTAFLTEI